MATLPLIPFAKLPRRDYNKKFEKKERLVWTEDDDFVPANPIEIEESSDSSSSGSSLDYDVLEHVKSLMPDYTDEGEQMKVASTIHLEDMRATKVKKERFTLVKKTWNYVATMRARERERRKHYIIKEYEERVRKFDEMQKKQIQDELEAQEKEIKIEAYRKEQRIKHNSKKKKEKSALADSFAKDLVRRDREAAQMEFFCEHFPVWHIEGMRRTEQELEDKKMAKQRKEEERQRKLAEEEKQRYLAQDQALLADDLKLSKQITTMMAKYGVIAMEKDTHSHASDVDYIFEAHRKLKKKQEKMIEELDDDDNYSADTESLSFLDSEASAKREMDLALLPALSSTDLIGVRNTLRKNRFKKDKRNHKHIWTVESFQDTADIHCVRCKKIGEVGALSLAVELSKGAFATLEVLDLQHCQVRDLGMARIFQAMKMSQLLTLKVLNLTSNLLTAKTIDYMREIASQSPILYVLEELHMSRNELGDDGLEAALRLIFLELMPCIRILVMSFNSITDRGFRAMVNALSAIHEVYCPRIECFNVSNNLITPALRRELAPIPSFISV